MQILEIVVYSRIGQKRVVKLVPGKVNIITGQSHTGKSALIHIVNYCLGGSTCQVPAGRILDAVSWFGLLLQVGNEKIFVARENPFPDHATSSTAALLRGVSASPDEPPGPNTDLASFESDLTRILGISANLNVPQPGSARPPLSANIRHSLFYCFQHQTEIASNQSLFHRPSGQPADFFALTVKDTLPYFLGAIQEQELALEEQLTFARRKLRQLEAEQRQNEQIRGIGTAKAGALVQEAINAGLLQDRPLPPSVPELRALMEQAVRWAPGQSTFAGSDRLSQLQDELAVATEERFRLTEVSKAARTMSGETQGFASEAHVQAERLESIGLFEEIGDGHASCPTCSQNMQIPTPAATAIRASLTQLSQSLASVDRERPQLRNYIEQINGQLQAVSEGIAEKEAAINALLNEQEASQRIRDLNSRRAKVVGRLSLYLESILTEGIEDELAARISAARDDVDALAAQLDPEEKNRRLESILSRIGLQMSEWSRTLEMEFSDSPVRLDISAATIVVDMPNRHEPLNRIGSGENWVGYHLVAHLALHRHFRQQRRPVPAFLFLDQPTQVYFPPDIDPSAQGDVGSLADDDRQKVERMFSLIFQAVGELAPEFQIIVTDHADLRNSQEFQEAIVQKWRGDGNALIPTEWA